MTYLIEATKNAPQAHSVPLRYTTEITGFSKRRQRRYR